MKKESQNGILYLISAGLILVLVNGLLVAGSQNGYLSPVSSPLLWGSFIVLGMLSLLWATGLMGLQPLIMAISYGAGGVLALQGVRFFPALNTPEIASAGATYSAFGAMLAGHIGARHRTEFFVRNQVPLAFGISGLLLLDGLLGSHVAREGSGALFTFLFVPFLLSGVLLALSFVALSHVGSGRGRSKRKKVRVAASGVAEAEVEDELEEEEPAELMIGVPDDVVVGEVDEDEAISLALNEDDDLKSDGDISLSDSMNSLHSDVPVATMDVDESSEAFFPVEIEEGEEVDEQESDIDLLALAGQVAQSSDDTHVEYETELESSEEHLISNEWDADEELEPEEEPVVVFEEPVEESIAPDSEVTPSAIEEDWAVEEISLEEKEEPSWSEDVATPKPTRDTSFLEHLPTPSKTEKPKEAFKEDSVDKPKKASSGNLLNDHLDILNKLKK